MLNKSNNSDDEMLTIGRNVLALESTAILELSKQLDKTFVRAITILKSVTGRIVVSGMGKSGHVARKIASTLASTGSPAQFVHPGEASHGDLGMIKPDDAILLLSNSGETRELADLLEYGQSKSIPLIAITSCAESSLARLADCAIILPNVEEADTLGLAPTTSTTLSLALGDALAVTLLQQKKFTRADFHNFHPGGKLGARLLPVSALMYGKRKMPIVDKFTSMQEALIVMAEKSFGCVGVCNEDGRLCGIITDGDLRRHMSDNLLKKTASEIMTSPPITVDEDTMAIEVLGLMNKKRITVIFAVKNEKPVGIIHLHDFLRAGLA